MGEISIELVVISPPHTAIKWSDGSVTSVSLGAKDTFSESEGVLRAIAKKFLSTTDIEKAIEMGKESIKNLRRIKE